MRFGGLNDRQKRGAELWRRAQTSNGLAVPFSEDLTLWFSATDATRVYQVTNAQRNRRGVLACEYRCQCTDFKKHGTSDCKHIFAERLRRREVVLIGGKKRESSQKATRRPARQRKDHQGRSLRTAQREARVDLGQRTPELVISLGNAYQRHSSGILIPIRSQRAPGGRGVTPHVTRAQALIYKISEGKSADDMVGVYRRLISDGMLRLDKAPHQNTLTNWMNDERLTPVLREFLRLTSLPFRIREIGAIVDSSKVSQLRNAHAKSVEYEGDERPSADWMKCHALVGVETMIVMAVEFSGSRNAGSHDINYVEPLVEHALKAFPLQFLLGDKAYLKSEVLDWLWERNLRAAIPLKKGWFREGEAHYSAAVEALVKWYDQDSNRAFHEVYRLRAKIEALFSILKRMARENCWSRGRHSDASKNADQPCTAWINETLCKFIYMNLRTTISLEHETGYRMDYTLPDRHFPAPNEPLLQRAA